jgi:hypothetical protein
MPQGHLVIDDFLLLLLLVVLRSLLPLLLLLPHLDVMNETVEENKTESLSLPAPVPIQTIVEDSIASRTKEITKRPKRERSPSKLNHTVCVCYLFLTYVRRF